MRAEICGRCGSAILDGDHLRDDLPPCFGQRHPHALSRNHAGLRPDGSLKAFSAHWTVFDKTCPVWPATHLIARRLTAGDSGLRHLGPCGGAGQHGLLGYEPSPAVNRPVRDVLADLAIIEGRT